ncbi:MAG: response regulator transcription factor [Verrucomicrobia bacterium]|nr:response regulator transcription factor [Verrucomicrobiota bacterium]
MSHPESKPFRLLLVDDHEVVRIGLKTLLGRYPEFEVVGEASTAASAVAESERLRPDVILLDIRLPDASGFEACRQIQQKQLPSRVLILTSFADENIVLDAIAVGADGYLLKEIGAEALVQGIKTVAMGQSILDPAVTRRVLGRVKSFGQSEATDKLAALSSQERRVIALVAEGKTNKEIATDLGLSDKTVKNYLSNLLEKLNLSRRSQAAAFFVHHSRR